MRGFRGHWRCSPKIDVLRWRPTRRSFSFACRTCGCVGRGNGAPVGWPGSCGGICGWSSSGPSACRRTARYALGAGLACAGLVSIDRTGQRVEVAPRLVRQERHGRPVGGGLRTGGGAQACACHDFLLQHKDALFSHLTARWCDLFNTNFDVLLYDLTSTYFEINASDVAEGDKRHHGYSRDKRPDCPQVVIALVVTPEGLPLAYEVLAGNTNDCKTLRMFLDKIEKQYGRARRVWVMDRGIPTEPHWPKCGPAIRRCSIWWERRKGASLVWKSSSWTSLGNKPAKASRSNCWQTTVNFTSSLKVTIASQRNVRCAGGS